jgi:hypothetical protein
MSGFQGTKRVQVTTITVGSCEARASLLEERVNVQVNAAIKGRSKDYDWVAKVLRSEAGPANYARFQGLLETEVNFYMELLPELGQLGAPLPRTFPLVWGDYKTLSREVLLLERQSGFQLSPTSGQKGLDLPHVLLAVEWLAKLHGLSYVMIKRMEAQNSHNDWMTSHPWVRREIEDSFKFAPSYPDAKADESDVAGSTLKSRLVAMTRKTLQRETLGDEKDQKLETLLERQDWLDEMRQVKIIWI